MRFFFFEKLFIASMIAALVCLGWYFLSFYGVPLYLSITGMRTLLGVMICAAGLMFVAVVNAGTLWLHKSYKAPFGIIGMAVLATMFFLFAANALYSMEIHSAHPIRNFRENHMPFMSFWVCAMFVIYIVFEREKIKQAELLSPS